MLPDPPGTNEHLIQFVEATGENDNVDAKGPVTWDGAETSASLAKDLMAFANSRNGGVIVIGKAEKDGGTFVLEGVSPEQAASFETTKVANWINSHCQPAMHLTCHTVEYDAKNFIVLVVEEFQDIPIICAKSYQHRNGFLLREGTIYVRTSSASSEPLQTVEQLRTLIGLACRKRGDEMLSTFKAWMEGEPLLQRPAGTDYADEIADLTTLLDAELGDMQGEDGWAITFHPGRYEAERWNDEELADLLDEIVVTPASGAFPGRSKNAARQTRGLVGQVSRGAFALNKSGLFMYRTSFRENAFECADPFSSKPNIPPGEWIDFYSNLRLIVRFFWFMSSFAHKLWADESLVYEIQATGLRDRRLASPDVSIDVGINDPCKGMMYLHKRAVLVPSLMTGWEDPCLAALTTFFRLFQDIDNTNVLRNWIERVKNPQA